MKLSQYEEFQRSKIYLQLIVSLYKPRNKHQYLGGNSQNFLGEFIRFFVTLGLKILRLFRLKVLFEADLIIG